VLLAVSALLGVSPRPAGAIAGAGVESLPPLCPARSLPPPNPAQPACVHGPWATPYATPIDGSARVTKTYEKHGSGRAFWDIDVRISYGAPLRTCPKPTSPGDVPCQEPGQSVFDYGVFIPGKRELQPLPAGVTGVVGEPDGICSVSHRTCLMTFYVFPDAFHGSLVMVWGVLVGDLTRDPHSQGPSPAGFEFPVALDIPAPGE
jgi:hypothetical protein